MTGSAEQSISPREERMHCFVASPLAMTGYRSNFQQPKLRSALTFDRVKIRGNRIDRYVRAVRDGQAITPRHHYPESRAQVGASRIDHGVHSTGEWPICHGVFCRSLIERGESGIRNILKPAISGNPSAASGDTKARTAAGTSLLISRSIALV